MKKKVVFSAAMLLCGLQISQAAPPAATAPSTAPRSAAPAPKPALSTVALDAKKTRVAASVDGEEILTADLNRLVLGVVEVEPRLAENNPNAKDALNKIRYEILENMIAQRVIYKEAKKDTKLLPTPDQIDTAVFNVQRRFANMADFNKWMADEGKTMEQLRDMLARRYVTEAWKNQIMTSIKPSGEDIRGYYNRNLKMFEIPDTVWARQIQISFPVDKQDGKPLTMTPQEKKKLQQKAQDLLNRAKSPTADFQALAKENSDDLLSKSRGGQLDIPEVNDRAEIVSFRQITREDKELVDPALFEVLMNTGVVNKVHPQVVETKYGFHIVKIEDRKAGRTLTITEVTEEIKPLILAELSKKAIDNRVKDLIAKSEIQRNFEFKFKPSA